MNRQILDFPLKTMSKLLSLAGTSLQRNHHIAQKQFLRFRLPVAKGRIKSPGLKLIVWERKNIRRPIHISELSVHLMDPLIIRQQNADEAGGGNTFRFQCTGSCCLNETGGAGVSEVWFLSADGDLVHVSLHLF